MLCMVETVRQQNETNFYTHGLQKTGTLQVAVFLEDSALDSGELQDRSFRQQESISQPQRHRRNTDRKGAHFQNQENHIHPPREQPWATGETGGVLHTHRRPRSTVRQTQPHHWLSVSFSFWVKAQRSLQRYTTNAACACLGKENALEGKITEYHKLLSL